MIIGGGLAGVTTAYALFRRGWQLTLLERHSQLAGEASANRRAALHLQLRASPGAINRFAMACYFHAMRFYRHLFERGILCAPRHGARCGVLQVLAGHKEQSEALDLLSFLGTEGRRRLSYLDARAASHRAGLRVDSPALWLGEAGWLDCSRLCRALAAAARAKLLLGTAVKRLVHREGHWEALAEDGQRLACAQVVILTSGTATPAFAQCSWLPLKTLRGQTSYLPSSPHSLPIHCVLNHHGYLTPAEEGLAGLGSTYDLEDSGHGLRIHDHQRNLNRLHLQWPQLREAWPDALAPLLTGHAAGRCTTPDYLPVVGAVPELPEFLKRYAPLRHHARRPLAVAPALLPGLFVNTAHGSRGLGTTPLSAEIIAALIEGEPRPLPREWLQALAPGRFLIRGLSRGQH